MGTRRTDALDALDVSAFADDVAAALAVIALDVSYAVAIARNAVSIHRKRAIWQARRELRAAEAAAHTECQTTGPFDCHAESACGTGDCKFARGEHAQLAAAAGPGLRRRPQRPHRTYSLDTAVAALVDQREAAL